MTFLKNFLFFCICKTLMPLRIISDRDIKISRYIALCSGEVEIRIYLGGQVSVSISPRMKVYVVMRRKVQLRFGCVENGKNQMEVQKWVFLSFRERCRKKVSGNKSFCGNVITDSASGSNVKKTKL